MWHKLLRSMLKDKKLALAMIALAIVVFGLVGASNRVDDPTRAFHHLAFSKSLAIGSGLTLLKVDFVPENDQQVIDILRQSCSEEAGWRWPKSTSLPLILTRNGSAESFMLEELRSKQIGITYSRPTRWTDYTLTWRGWR